MSDDKKQSFYALLMMGLMWAIASTTLLQAITPFDDAVDIGDRSGEFTQALS
ncbi:hypothetical protein LC593_08165 [Nostoc sp. CHAB 5844]|nr:hypothetical protein [Nostoc sp. CHAB 5844]